MRSSCRILGAGCFRCRARPASPSCSRRTARPVRPDRSLRRHARRMPQRRWRPGGPLRPWPSAYGAAPGGGRSSARTPTATTTSAIVKTVTVALAKPSRNGALRASRRLVEERRVAVESVAERGGVARLRLLQQLRGCPRWPGRRAPSGRRAAFARSAASVLSWNAAGDRRREAREQHREEHRDAQRSADLAEERRRRLVATPMSRGPTEFCDAMVSVCISWPRPRPTQQHADHHEA